MNTDELLIQFRSNIALPDERAAQQTYARATDGHSPVARRRAIAGLAAAAISASAIAWVATGGLTTNSHRPPPAAPGPTIPLVLPPALNRDDSGTLQSVDVTVSAGLPDAEVQLQVLHHVSTGIEVVFAKQLSTTDIPPAALYGPTGAQGFGPPVPGRSFWSGSLYPSDWDGGCQPGLYELKAVASVDGRLVETGGSLMFSCTAG